MTMSFPKQSVVAHANPVISRRSIGGSVKRIRHMLLSASWKWTVAFHSIYRIAPLSRLTLLSASPDCHHLVWTFPHVLLDGRSISIILEDLVESYSSLCAGLVYEKEAAPLILGIPEFPH
jgi:hypothetical protein